MEDLNKMDTLVVSKEEANNIIAIIKIVETRNLEAARREKGINLDIPTGIMLAMII